MLILENPVFSWKDISRAIFVNKNNSFNQLWNSDFILYATARQALYYGLKLLALPPKTKVWIPAYICNSAVYPIEKAGLIPEFYDIDDYFQPKWDTIFCKKGEVVIIVHYFGLSQPIEKILEFCKNKKVFLVEDAAHCLPDPKSSIKIGEFGDFSIFSLRKQLPLINGALLKVNSMDLKEKVKEVPILPHSKNNLKKVAIFFISKIANDFFNINILKFKDYLKAQKNSESSEFGFFLEENNNFAPSSLSSFLLKGMNLTERIEKKKECIIKSLSV